MTALLTSTMAFRRAKNHLHARFPSIKSSHLSEALAASLGFNTHAAWLNHLQQSMQDPDIRLLNGDWFEKRVATLGYEIGGQGLTDNLFIGVEDGEFVFATSSTDAVERRESSKRESAWQNLMIAGINAGINQKIFSLRADDNRWPGYRANKSDSESSYVYHFTLGDLPASVYVQDISFGELGFHVMLQPTGTFASSMDAGFASGEASGGGWLERRDGLWLQESRGVGMFRCRQHLIDWLANLDIAPLGYGRVGKFYR